jgi:TonB family protein
MEDKMRKFIKFTCISALFILLVNSVAAQEKVIFESFLLKGIREDEKPSATVTISSFSEPFIVHMDPSVIESKMKFVSHLKDELKTIYHFKDVELLAQGTTIWDGTKDHLNEWVLLYKKSYFMRLFPEILWESKVNLKIEVSRYTWEALKVIAKSASFIRGQGKEQLALFEEPVEMTISDGSILTALDTEIVIGFNEPLVLGFPSDKDSYFLSLLITKKDLSRYAIIGGVEGGVIGGVEGEVIGGVVGGIKGGVEGEGVGGVLGSVVGGAYYFSIQATDPVCGKKVARGKILEIDEDRIRAEVTYTYKGKTYFFCSNECLEKFKKNPEKYIKKDEVKIPQTTTIKPVRREGQLGVEVIIPTPIRRITPVYPEKCKKEGIEGTVVLEIKIDEEGNVIDVQVLKSVHPDLDKAAMEAIKKWKYKPVLKDGKPEPVVFAVTINFWLRENG